MMSDYLVIVYVVIVVALYVDVILPSHVSTFGPLNRNSLIVRYFHLGV